MSYLSLGDLAMHFRETGQNARIKAQLQRLSEEMATGRRSDLGTGVAGDLSLVSDLERSLRIGQGFATVAADAALAAEAVQTALTTIQANSTELGPALLVAADSEHPTMISTTATDATYKFDAIVAAINVRVADRYVLAGTTPDRPALADGATILADIELAVAGQTTAAGVVAAVDAWFDTPGGGFDTVAHTGATTAATPFHLAEGREISLDVLANDPALRETLKGFALAAMLDRGVLATDTGERAALARAAGEGLMTAEAGLTALRARVGSIEARVAEVSAQNVAEMNALEMARNDLVAVDPFQTATELEAVRNQLETFYAVTARLAQLSLADRL